MPCRSDYMPSPDEEIQKSQRDKIDLLTRMLCNIMKGLENSAFELTSDLGLRNKDADEILEWWEHYQEIDEKRLENIRRSTLAKLTDDEKEALGLDECDI